MTTVWLIRHGETATNGQSYAGRSDVPLTPRGHAQAREIAGRLSGHHLDAILCSPLRRALDTAGPLSRQTGLAVTPRAELMEFDFGTFEGRPKAHLSLSLRRSHLTTPVPGGESLSELWDRTGALVRMLHQMPAKAQVAVVGHYWTNRMLYGHLTGLSLTEAAKSRAYRPETGDVLSVMLKDGRNIYLS